MFNSVRKIHKQGWSLLLLWILVTTVLADSSEVIQPIPETGAFSASFREDRGAISIIDFAGNYDKDIDGLPNFEPRAVVAREFLRTHTDEYDFLVVFSTFEFETIGAQAFHLRLQNQVQGIGINQYDNSASFGSNGRLLGYTDMAALSRYVTNPLDPEFEGVLSVLGHEILHQWSGNVRFDQGAGPDTALIGKDDSHWSNLLDSDASVLYGHKWRDNGDGTFTSAANFKFFSALDLYLAGFYGADEVPPMNLIINPEVNHRLTPSQSLSQYGPTISGTTRQVTIDDIIAAEGPRSPSVAESQKNYRFAFIMLAGVNETVTQSQVSAVDQVRRSFVDRFPVWTGGRATVNAYSQGLPVAQTGSPDVVVGGEPRIDSADVNDAFSWLRTQQDTDGFWRDKETTTLRDTVVVTDILARFDVNFQRETDALDWLAAVETENTDYLARQASLLQGLGRDSLAATIRDRLLAQQNADGGWGIDTAFASNSLDTALVVLALHGQADASGTVLTRAVDYLLVQQNADGGWGNREGSPSRTSVTTTVVQALRRAGLVQSVSELAIAYLASKQNSDGGFGDSPSTVHDTSNVLLALTDLEALDQVRTGDASSYLITRQTSAGDWVGSTYATALAALALQRLNIGNWAVSLSELTPSSPNDGDQVQLTFTVSNDTNQAMPSTVLRVLDGNTQIGTDFNVTALSAGQNTDISLYWNTFGLPGEHTISAIVDPDAVELETSERDNRVDTNVSIAGAPSGVDFSISQEDVAVMPANPTLLPTTLGFAIAVRNLGLSDTTAVSVQLRAGSQTGAILEEQWFDIPGRGSIAANFSYEMLDTSINQFVIVVDSNDQYLEARENNNTVVISLGTESTLDLAVSDADITADTSSAIVGEDVSFEVTLRNRGTLNSPSVGVRYLITDGTDTTELATNIVQIDAGGSVTQNIVWRVDREGALTFSVQLDPNNLLPELFEDNNTASFNLTSGQANGPNLVVNFLDFTFDPEPGLEAQPVTLTAQVRNTGNLAADNIEVGFYDGDPDQGGALIESLQTISSLVLGASANVSVTLPALSDSQDRLLFVVVDPNNTVQEYSETDNKAFNILEVLSLPDLALSADDITLTPGFPTNGDTVAATVRVANLGQQSAGNTVIRIFDGDPGFGGIQIGSDLSLVLEGNQSGVVSFTFTLPADGEAMQALYVQVDPDDQILEQTELNNIAEREFSVQDGDFVVSQRFISPNGDGVQDGSDFLFRLEQETDVEIVIIDERDLIVQRFTGNEWRAVGGGQLHWDGLDESERVVADGLYRLQVQDLNGSVLGSATVTVDNNRSPLLRAEGTEYARYSNLTCNIWGTKPLAVAEDDDGIVFLNSYDTGSLLGGVYRMDGNGGNIQTLNTHSVFGDYARIIDVTVNADLSLIHYDVHVYEADIGTYYQHWISDGNGESLRRLQGHSDFSSFGFGPDNKMIIMHNWIDKVKTVPLDGSAATLVVDLGDPNGRIREQQLSPDHRKFLLEEGSVDFRKLILIDLPNKTRTDILDYSGTSSWSPDGSRFAVVNTESQDVSIFSQTGALLKTISWAGIVSGSQVYRLSKPRWSSVTDELAFGVSFLTDFFGFGSQDGGGLFLVDIGAETVERVYDFPTMDGGPIRLGGLGLDQSESTETAFSPSGNFSEFLWVPNERTWLLKAHDFNSYPAWAPTAAFFLDGDRKPLHVFNAFSDEESQQDFRFSISGQQLLYESGLESTDSVCDTSRNTWSFRSLLNLTTDLRAVRSERVGGILLSGTASDLNFSQYRLDYAYADTPDVWRPVQPSSGQSVIDGQFTAWIPPSPGSYLVRLTATDLAGNQRQKINRVSWNETPAITDLFRAPELFSPNGDGIADVSNIQYRTLTPVHLEFVFYDANGNLVRRIVRDHTEIGQNFQINWDGRDDDGLLLADGEYRMTVQNYELFFHIDTSFPEVSFALQDAYQPEERFDSEGNSLGQFASAQAQVNWSILDQNYTDSIVEWASVLNPNGWQVFKDPDPAKKNADGKIEGGGLLTLSTSDGYKDEASGRIYRMMAEDGAGNRTTVSLDPIAEQLMVLGFGAHKPNPALELALQEAGLKDALLKSGGWYDRLESVPYAEMGNIDGGLPAVLSVSGETRFQIKETLFKRLFSLDVQYRLLSETNWRSSKPELYFDEAQFFSTEPIDLSSVSDVDVAYHAVWVPPADISPNTNYAIRLRGVDADGREYLSNAFRARFTESLSFEGLRRQSLPEDIPLIDQLLDSPPATDEYVLWGRVSTSEPLSSVQVFVSSSDDPRYAIEREIGVFYNAVDAFAVKTRDLSSCHNYRVRLVGRIDARIDPDTDEQIPGKTFETQGGSFQLPCLELDVRVKPMIAAICNASPQQALRIEFSPRSTDGAPLKLLSLSTEDSQDVVFNVNEPNSVPLSSSKEPVFNYQFILDTSGIEAGSRVFKARLLNSNDEFVTLDVPLIIDHVPPQASISFPAANDKICGVPRVVNIDGQSEIFNVMSLEGQIQDDNALGYFLEYNPGDGYNAEIARRFHDSNSELGLNSFQAANALGADPKPRSSFAASRPMSHIQPALSGNRKSGSLGELFNISGENTVRLHTYDWGGHQICTDRVFTFDGDVELSSVTVNRKLFSPNGDGIADTIEMGYVLDESANLDVEIFAATVDDNNVQKIVGNTLRVIESNLSVLAGASQVEWDGTDPAGTAMIDGLYAIRLSFTDSCGNIRREVRYVELDNTTPAVNILFPLSTSQLPLMTEVQGTITDKNFNAFKIDVGSGSDPETWLKITDSKRAVPEPQVLAVWNTFGLQGDYTLRVIASDLVGNQAEVLIPLTLTEPLSLVSYLEAVEAMFSPNGDGRRESTSIRFGLEQEVIVNLSVIQGGQVVRELLTDQTFSPGPRTVNWNGDDSNGLSVADGVYRIQLSAVSVNDSLISQTETITVTVDSTLPTVEITQPENGFMRSGLPVVGTISDVHLSDYSLSISNVTSPSWEEIASGNSSRVNSALAVLSSELEGDFMLRVVAGDLAENRVEQLIPFTIDNTPPQVNLTQPLKNAFVNGQTALAISADVIEKNPASYLLQFSSVGSDVQSEIVSGDSFPLPAVLTEWDVAAINDGAYNLNFSVKDLAGNSAFVDQVLTIDKTPPSAVITTPQDNSYVTNGTSIEGVVSDLNLTEYRLEIAPGEPATAEQYSLLGSSTVSVDQGELFEFTVLPQDGRYSLRLTVEDLAGNSSEAFLQVIVDTTPPSQPDGLTAEIENDQDIRLQWNDNSELDLAGYLVFRDTAQITPEPINISQYVDVTVTQGSYQYTVRAVDSAGNISDDSPAVDIVIDLQPPTVRISSPVAGSKVSGLVDIRGTAYSPGDFKEYRLYIARADALDLRQLLRQSPVPVQADTLAEWNTISLPEGVEYVISLEGEDINGNIALEEAAVSIDNLAPAQPTGLTLVANGADVNLSWNANTEADLFGYLVLRNDSIANSTGTVVGELQPYAIFTNGYTDLTLPDGTYSYTIIAIDDAGNLSDVSLPTEATIDTRTPQATIIQPTDGVEFEQPQYVLAVAEDNDVATVEFQYRGVGSSAWISLGLDNELPFDFDFDPAALSLAIGDYELSAIATDRNNQTDASPGFITIKYRDLTAPVKVANLLAHVNGGDVSLSWLANSETDLAGYHLDRFDADDVATRLTNELLLTNNYVDAGLADGQYRYQVIAVDLSGNESVISDAALAVIYTPAFEPYFVPTEQTSISLNGQGVTQATVNTTVSNSAGTVDLAPIATDAEGVFVLQVLLEAGDNALVVRLTDVAGNVSKSVNLEIVRGVAPSRPTGLTGSTNDTEVSLNWNSNPETDIAGYRVFRNGEAVLAEQAITGLIATTSNAYSWAPGAQAVDGDVYTYWRTPSPYEDQWIVVEWAEPKMVAAVNLHWRYPYWGIVNYDIEADFQGNWVVLEQLRNIPYEIEHKVKLATPYMTTKIRFVAREDSSFLLAEITPMHIPLVTSAAFVETAPNGVQEYTVTAVSTLGFESEPSAPAELSVGDVTAPDTVALTAVANGSDVDLSWTASTAPDIAGYDLYRDGVLIAELTDIGAQSYRDLGLPNGTYIYHVVVLDQIGNQSVPSNEELVTIDTFGTFDLTVNADTAGSTLSLNWAAPVGITPNEYRIFRAESAGGIYSQIDQVAGTVLNYLDTNLENETTKYYVVVAADESNAKTTVSIEASGTPLDTVAPIVPVLHAPTRAGTLYLTTEDRATITGTTAAAANVELIVDGRRIQTAALAEPEILGSHLSNIDGSKLSPNGEMLVYAIYDPWSFTPSTLALYNFETSLVQLVYQSTQYTLNPQWFSDGKRIVFIDKSESNYKRYVRIYSVEERSFVNVTDSATSDIEYASPSPDGTKMVLLGTFVDTAQTGLWLLDLNSGDKTLLREGPTYQFPMPQWSPDGKQIAYLNRAASPETIEIYQLDTATALDIGESTTSDNAISWSPDSNALVYHHHDSLLGQYVISRYTIDSGLSDVLVSDPGTDLLNPRWSPDGRQIAYVDNIFDQLHTFNVDTGADNIVFDDGNVWGLEQWSNSGHILVERNNVTTRVTPVGHFEFPDVSLNLGENEFSAVATDGSGNASSVSDSIVVVRSLGDLADLSVRPEDIILLPAGPTVNETVQVGITIHNSGRLSSGPASFSALVIDPLGQSVELVAPAIIGGMAAGTSQTVTADWPIGNESGEYTLVVIVDAENSILELNEANNTVIMPQLVSGEGGLISTIAMDATAYISGQPASVTIEISNSGNGFDGRYEVSIEDEQGVSVAKLSDELVQNLSFGQSITRDLEWNTGTTFAGVYRARLSIWDAENRLISSESTDFSISASFQVEASVSTDRTHYDGNSNLRLAGTVNYTAGNVVLDGASASLRIINESGELLMETIEPIAVLIPGSSRAVSTDWNTGTQPAGLYRVELRVTQNGNAIALAQSDFRIESNVIQVNGSLSLVDEVPDVGGIQQVSFSINNVGNTAIEQMPVMISLLDPGAQSVLQVETILIDINVNDLTTGVANFSTAELSLDTYNLLLQVEVPDANGQLLLLNLDTASFSLQDRTPPILALVQPLANDFINTAKEARFTAEDSLTAIDQAAFQIDGGEWITAVVRDAANSEYGRVLPVLSETTHTLRARATDNAGNTGFSETISFTVDNTAPSIVVDGVSTGVVYGGSVVPVVTVIETNLAETYIALNDESFVSGTPVVGEGQYELFVEVTDLAQNSSQLFLSFVIDNGPPLIEINGVVDGQLFNTSVTPEITITDANLTVTSITLNGESYIPGTTIVAEGEYQLQVTATDLAGHSSSQTLDFRIDLTPPTLIILEPQDGIFVDTPTVRISGKTEPAAFVVLVRDTAQTSILADGSGLFVFDDVEVLEGENLFTLSVTDLAGNSGEDLALTVFRVTAQQIELSGSLAVKPRVLAWIPGVYSHEGGAVLPPLAQMLTELLGKNDIDYKLADGVVDFRQSLFSQVYNVVLVADIPPGLGGFCQDTGHQDDCQTLVDELKLGVAGGMGLVMISTHPDNSNKLLDIMESKYSGLSSDDNNSKISLIDSPISEAKVLDILDRGVVLQNLGGLVAGTHLPKNSPAVVINAYHNGKTALVGFDPSNLTDSEQAKRLLSNLFDFATPQTLVLLPGSVVDLQWSVSEVEPPLDVTLTQISDGRIGLLNAVDGEIVDEQTVSWQRVIESEQDVFNAIIRLPFEKGDFVVNADLAKSGDVLTSLQVSELVISTDQDLDDLGAALLQTMQAVETQKKNDASRIEEAIWLVQEATNTPRDTSEAVDSALDNLLSAYETVESTGLDLPDINAQIGLLYRIYQLEWYRLATGNSQ